MTTEPPTPAARLGIGTAIEVWRKRLVKHQFDAMGLDLPQSVSAITRRGLTVLLMLAVSGLVGFLPGAGIVLFRGLAISLLLKFGIAVAVVWIMFTAYRQTVCVLGHFARSAFPLPPDDPAHDDAILKLAWNVTLLVYVCLVYWVFMRAASPILSAMTTSKWPTMAMDIGSLVVAVVAIIGILVSSSPLFGKVGDAVARRVGAEPGSAPQLKCLKCGVLYTEESRYCAFCGAALPRTPKNTDGMNVQAEQPVGED